MYDDCIGLVCSVVLTPSCSPPGNQFRSLEEDEVHFLDSIQNKKEAEERQRKMDDKEQVRGFHEYGHFYQSLHRTTCSP